MRLIDALGTVALLAGFWVLCFCPSGWIGLLIIGACLLGWELWQDDKRELMR